MGRPFLEHMGGRKYYTCNQCKTYLSNKKEILSHTFRGWLWNNQNLFKFSVQGSTGQAYLFRTVVNIITSKVESRYMITGQHIVRDVFCKNCNSKLGWWEQYYTYYLLIFRMYEFAHEPQQSYKEGI